jgi:DNA-binding GntR family transcriptional regulator
MPLDKLPARTDYVDAVYDSLLQAICNGNLKPGSRIIQEELARELNVSRSPILQALRMLKKDGLLEEAPGRGLLVTRLSPEHIKHLYEVRGALDALAAQLAARHIGAGAPKISPALLSAGRSAADGDDVLCIVEADIKFHTAIYQAAQNPYLLQTAMGQWLQIRRVMAAIHQHQGLARRSNLWQEHEAIAEAINQGKEALAAERSIAHCQRASSALIKALDNQNP